MAVCSLLLELGASLDATDDFGQKPIHLAAQSNKAEVVKVLLKLRPNSVSVATKVNVIYYLRLMKMLFENIRHILVSRPTFISLITY